MKYGGVGVEEDEDDIEEDEDDIEEDDFEEVNGVGFVFAFEDGDKDEDGVAFE